jgi:hypothetical protein
MHFMADVSRKVDQVMEMIARGDYFAVNRPRQYGKTTLMYLLEQRLLKKKGARRKKMLCPTNPLTLFAKNKTHSGYASVPGWQ